MTLCCFFPSSGFVPTLNKKCPCAVTSVDGKRCIGTKHYSSIKAYLSTLKMMLLIFIFALNHFKAEFVHLDF